MTHSSIYRSLLAAVLLILPALPSRAEVLIYDLSFSNVPSSVNYSFVKYGYLIVDPSAGTFSSVVVLTDPNTFLLYSTSSLLSGNYTTLLSEANGNEYAVLSSTGAAGNGADNLTFQVVGELRAGVRVGGGMSVDAARQLRGVFTAFAAETSTSNSTVTSNATTSNSTTSNSTTSNSTTSNGTTTSNSTTSSNSTTTSGDQTTFTFGFAGQSRVRASLNFGFTQSANGAGLDSAAAQAIVSAELVNQGVNPESTATPTASPTPTQ